MGQRGKEGMGPSRVRWVEGDGLEFASVVPVGMPEPGPELGPEPEPEAAETNFEIVIGDCGTNIGEGGSNTGVGIVRINVGNGGVRINVGNGGLGVYRPPPPPPPGETSDDRDANEDPKNEFPNPRVDNPADESASPTSRTIELPSVCIAWITALSNDEERAVT